MGPVDSERRGPMLWRERFGLDRAFTLSHGSSRTTRQAGVDSTSGDVHTCLPSREVGLNARIP